MEKFKLTAEKLREFNSQVFTQKQHEKLGQRVGQYFVNYFLPLEFHPCSELFYARNEHEFYDRINEFVEYVD